MITVLAQASGVTTFLTMETVAGGTWTLSSYVYHLSLINQVNLLVAEHYAGRCPTEPTTFDVFPDTFVTLRRLPTSHGPTQRRAKMRLQQRRLRLLPDLEHVQLGHPRNGLSIQWYEWDPPSGRYSQNRILLFDRQFWEYH